MINLDRLLTQRPQGAYITNYNRPPNTSAVSGSLAITQATIDDFYEGDVQGLTFNLLAAKAIAEQQSIFYSPDFTVSSDTLPDLEIGDYIIYSYLRAKHWTRNAIYAAPTSITRLQRLGVKSTVFFATDDSITLNNVRTYSRFYFAKDVGNVFTIFNPNTLTHDTTGTTSNWAITNKDYGIPTKDENGLDGDSLYHGSFAELLTNQSFLDSIVDAVNTSYEAVETIDATYEAEVIQADPIIETTIVETSPDISYTYGSSSILPIYFEEEVDSHALPIKSDCKTLQGFLFKADLEEKLERDIKHSFYSRIKVTDSFTKIEAKLINANGDSLVLATLENPEIGKWLKFEGVSVPDSETELEVNLLYDTFIITWEKDTINCGEVHINHLTVTRGDTIPDYTYSLSEFESRIKNGIEVGGIGGSGGNNSNEETDPFFVNSEAFKFTDGDKAKLDSALQEEIDPTVPNHVKTISEQNIIDWDEKAVGLSTNQGDQTLNLLDKDGNILDTVSVAFLNNEGTQLVYNEVTGNIELKDDEDNILSSFPASSLVSNLPNNLNLNGTILELRDSDNNVLSSVTLNINKNLQQVTDVGNITTNDIIFTNDRLGTDSNRNFYFGKGTFSSITTGAESIAVGYNVLRKVTTGSASVSMGHYALESLITGIGNTAFGYNAGTLLESGKVNTFVGLNAGNSLKTGDGNTLLSSNTGKALENGNSNVYIGLGAGSASSTLLDTSGNFEIRDESNKLRIHSYKLDSNFNWVEPIVGEKGKEELIYGDFSERYIHFNGTIRPSNEGHSVFNDNRVLLDNVLGRINKSLQDDTIVIDDTVSVLLGKAIIKVNRPTEPTLPTNVKTIIGSFVKDQDCYYEFECTYVDDANSSHNEYTLKIFNGNEGNSTGGSVLTEPIDTAGTVVTFDKNRDYGLSTPINIFTLDLTDAKRGVVQYIYFNGLELPVNSKLKWVNSSDSYFESGENFLIELEYKTSTLILANLIKL